MTPADSVAAVSAVDTLSDSLAQAGQNRFLQFFRAYSFQAGRKAQADSLKAQLAGTGRHSVREKARRQRPQGEAGADRQSTSGSGYCQARRCETEGGRHCAERTWSAAPNVWRKSGPSGVPKPGRRSCARRLRPVAPRPPCGRPGLCRVGFFVPGLSCCGFAGTRFHAARFAQGRGLRQRTLCGGFDRCTCWRFPLPVGQGVSPGKIFRNDFQAVCDSLVAVSTDSVDPALYRSRARNQDNQITSRT